MRDKQLSTNRDDLDRLLDRALVNYVDQEPDAGLSARISARIGEAKLRRWRAAVPKSAWLPKTMWVFGPATACAAVLLFALLYHPSHVQIPQLNTASTIGNPARTIANTVPPQSVHPHVVALAIRRERKDRQTAPLRADSFPTPTPLTPNEILLLTFAAEHPEQAVQVLTRTPRDTAPIETKPLSIAPIRIAALRIAALEDAESQKSDN